MKRYLYSLWAMARPLFLVGITPLYALGAAAAWHHDKVIRVSILVSGLFLVWLIQLMTHYNNEYYDLETDLATEVHTRISGGSRVLVRNLVPRAAARIAAIISLFLAIVLAVIMVTKMGTGAAVLGFAGAAAFLGWSYSARPLRLESTGLGEAVIVIVSIFLLPLMSYFIQTSSVRPGLLIACVPLALLTLALILTTEIPDFSADKTTGKRTLVVRLGMANAMRLIGIALTTGWLAFGAVIVYLWPFWGWISAVVSLPVLLVIGLNMRAAGQEHLASIENMGLVISLLLGYATICLVIAFLTA
jgi:1,4-dihydroxy-2-naphthoate octaprenyltransferase